LVGLYMEKWSSTSQYRQGEIVLASDGCFYEAQLDLGGGELQDPMKDTYEKKNEDGMIDEPLYQYWLPLGRVDFVDISNNTIHYPCCRHHRFSTLRGPYNFPITASSRGQLREELQTYEEQDDKDEDRGFGYKDRITGTEGYIGISLAAGHPSSGNPPFAKAFVRNNLMLRGDGDQVRKLDYSVYSETDVELHAVGNWFDDDCNIITVNTPGAKTIDHNIVVGWDVGSRGDPKLSGKGLGPGRLFFANRPPNTGTHWQGDVVFNIAPTTGHPIGWVCTEFGTPGTWRPFGVIYETP